MHFPLTTVLIFVSCGPGLTVIIGGVFSNMQKVPRLGFLKVTTALTGLLLVTLGAPWIDGVGNEHKNHRIEYHWYLMMVTMPLTLAFGNLAMGKLKTLDPTLIPFYSNLCIFVISTLVCSLNGQGFFPAEEETREQGMLLFWLVAFLWNGVSFYFSW